MGLAQRVAVFVPAHNEAVTLANILAGIKQRSGKHQAVLVVVDDGSTDNTTEVARQFTPHVVVAGSPGMPTGNGAATRAALQHISGLPEADGLDSVIRLDGDGQHDPSMIGHVIALIEEGCDIAVCSRFHPRSTASAVPLNRELTNWNAASWMSRVTGLTITDARSGFFGNRWRLVKPILSQLKTDGYGIPMELFLRVWHHAKTHGYMTRHFELPHPALYGRDLQRKLQEKWDNESPADQAKRLAIAFQVYLETCRELGLDSTPDHCSAEREDSSPRRAETVAMAANVQHGNNGLDAKGNGQG
jgi:glycosyltransferase involved in cell wall biosynthesis